MLMNSYGWSVEYCMKLTRSQILLFGDKIKKRKEMENNFQKSLHGAEVKTKGLNTAGAVPIEDIIDQSVNNVM